MNLIASLIVRNELGRYLEPCIRHLQEFCDEIRVLDDRSADGTFEWLQAQDRVVVRRNEGPHGFEDEGRARQTLLAWTLEAAPSHVLAVDADEFVSDGPALRVACETSPAGLLSLTVVEVWKASGRLLFAREDGGWRRHGMPCVWCPGLRADWRIMPRKLACRRIPLQLHRVSTVLTGVQLLHFGWTDQSDRARRHRRYATLDRGRFHARSHLESILWPDDRCELAPLGWPDGLAPWRDAILERCAPKVAA